MKEKNINTAKFNNVIPNRMRLNGKKSSTGVPQNLMLHIRVLFYSRLQNRIFMRKLNSASLVQGRAIKPPIYLWPNAHFYLSINVCKIHLIGMLMFLLSPFSSSQSRWIASSADFYSMLDGSNILSNKVMAKIALNHTM